MEVRKLTREAGIKTFEFAAPSIMVATIVGVVATAGWKWGVALAVSYLASAALAWRAAYKSYKAGKRE